MTGLLARLGHQDQRLLQRWSMAHAAPHTLQRGWMALTQLGSAWCTMPAALLAGLAWNRQDPAGWHTFATLAGSHLLVQALKRSVQRDRPEGTPLIRCPDRFSFPSGHATASLAVALGYADLFPELTVPLLALGLIVGWSRVVLGVHYPGDVVMGQLLAAGSWLVVQGLN